MTLGKIGFLEITDNRVQTAGPDSPLNYCELLLTHHCNYRCGYCNPLPRDTDLPLVEVLQLLDLLADQGLKYLHLTGGEVTVRQDLLQIVTEAKDRGMRVGISSNGSAGVAYYRELVEAGVEMFSFSLDANGDQLNSAMCGIAGEHAKVSEVIREIARVARVNVGIVLDDDNIADAANIIAYVSSLGPHDIRLGSATRCSAEVQLEISTEILQKHPILAYRVHNFNSGRDMRGLTEQDSGTCWLMLDDVSIMGRMHYPCAVYAREGGAPVGLVSPAMRAERLAWLKEHDCRQDPICQKFCMDFKCDYNRAFADLNPGTKTML